MSIGKGAVGGLTDDDLGVVADRCAPVDEALLLEAVAEQLDLAPEPRRPAGRARPLALRVLRALPLRVPLPALQIRLPRPDVPQEHQQGGHQPERGHACGERVELAAACACRACSQSAQSR
eukprot:3788649-Rhodomonas_salina.3